MERLLTRLIAFDLDGTLLDLDKTIPARSLDVVRELRAHGCKIAVITGRSVVPDDVQEGLAPDATATNNGGVVQVGETTVAEHLLGPEQVRAVLNALPSEARVFAIGEDALFVKDPENENPENKEWNGMAVRPLAELGERSLRQLGVRFDGAHAFRERLLALGGLTVTGGLEPYSYFLTVTTGAANKGSALREIAAALHIPMRDTIVFGDSDNDVDMFKVAGVAVQVGEAECLIDHAHHRVSCSALGLPGWLENYAGELARELA